MSFFPQKKISLKLKRLRTIENRDLINGLRLNRNERVLDYPKDILNRIFKKNQSYHLAKYPDHTELYKNISKFFRINKKNFLLTNGIDGGLKTIFETLTKPGDKICALHPSYGMYEVFAKIFKTRFVKISYNTKSFKLDKKRLEIEIKKKPKLLILPNPNQPIEDYLNQNYINRVANLCKKNKVILILDEAYHMFGSKSSINLIKKYENVIILRSFSKSFGLPSIRLGYMVSNQKNIKFFDLFRLTYESNYLADAVASYFLKNPNLVKKYNMSVIKGRDFLKKKLKGLGLEIIGNKSNFLLIKFENNEITSNIKKKLERKKIYVRSYTGDLKNCILVTCGPKKIMKIFFNQINQIYKSNINKKKK